MGRISIWFEQEMNSDALQSSPILARASLKVIPSTRELIMAAAIAVALLLCVNLPYALAYFLPQPNREFTGVLMNPEDSNSYLAKMQQGYEGEWLYHIPFTAEEHAPAFLGGFYVLLGQLARLTALSVIQMWHLARLTCALVMCLVVYGFIKSFLADSRTRRLAYLIALFGSGLGWVVFLFGQVYWLGDMPVDFRMPEAHLFFTALTYPHFIAGTTFLMASVWLARLAFDTGRFRFAVVAGVVNLALGVVYPFLIYLIGLILLLYWLFRSFELRRPDRNGAISILIALAVPAPLFFYYLSVLQSNPVMRAWDAQAITASPNPLHYLLAYGVLLILAVPTMRRRDLTLLWLWVFSVALLLYAPLNPQRRFVEGVQVPLAILAATGVTNYYLPRLRHTKVFQRLAARPNYSVPGLERMLLVLLIALLTLSNLYVLSSTSVTAVLEQPDPLFRSPDEIAAVDWAGTHLPPNAVVLSAYETGSLIPTRTNLRSVIGHWAETKDFMQKYEKVGEFFGSTRSDAWRNSMLRELGVDFVIYGERERALGQYDPASSMNLSSVYEGANTIIFRVNHP